MPDGRQFLMRDSGGPNRIIIFTTDELLGELGRHTNWAGDVTFSIIPPIFHNRGCGQLYTIHAKIGITYSPVVFFLMEKRDRTTYLHGFGME